MRSLQGGQGALMDCLLVLGDGAKGGHGDSQCEERKWGADAVGEWGWVMKLGNGAAGGWKV